MNFYYIFVIFLLFKMKTDAEILSNETKTNGNEMEHINLSQKTIIDFSPFASCDQMFLF